MPKKRVTPFFFLYTHMMESSSGAHFLRRELLRGKSFPAELFLRPSGEGGEGARERKDWLDPTCPPLGGTDRERREGPSASEETRSRPSPPKNGCGPIMSFVPITVANQKVCRANGKQ